FGQVYPQRQWASTGECASYFRDIFFANPWRHLELPSWVAVVRGAIAGFAGVLPRPMMFGTRPVRAAVGCQFMIHPQQRRSLLTLQLIKKALCGPQDLFLTDGSNDEARRVWLGIGGTVPVLQNLYWTRLLRPARYMLGLIGKNAHLR